MRVGECKITTLVDEDGTTVFLFDGEGRFVECLSAASWLGVSQAVGMLVQLAVDEKLLTIDDD